MQKHQGRARTSARPYRQGNLGIYLRECPLELRNDFERVCVRHGLRLGTGLLFVMAWVVQHHDLTAPVTDRMWRRAR